ncbi:Inner membrane transport protein YajR [compost metagenome]
MSLPPRPKGRSWWLSGADGASPPAPGGDLPPLYTRDFLLASVAAFTGFGSMYLLLASLPLYVLALGGKTADVGLVMAIYTLAAVVARPLMGRALSGGRKPMMIAGALGMAGSIALYLLPLGLAGFFGVRALHGLVWAAWSTAAATYVTDIAPPQRRGEAMGAYGISFNLAMVVAPGIGLAVAQASWPMLFGITAALALVTAGLCALLPEPPRHAAPGRVPLISREALLPSSIMALFALSYGGLVSFVPLFAPERALPGAGWFFATYAIALMVSRQAAGKLSDRFGRTLMVLPGLLAAAGSLFWLSTTHSSLGFLGSAALYGLAFAMIQPALMAMAIDRAGSESPGHRGAAMATFSLAMDLGIGLGSFGLGLVAAASGIPGMFGLSAVLCLGAIAIYQLGQKKAGGGVARN